MKKETLKRINKIPYYTIKDFKKDAKLFINGLKDKSLLIEVTSVSSNGMSRKMRVLKYIKNSGFVSLSDFFRVLGFKVDNNNGYVNIKGTGMDMVFYLKYSTIQELVFNGIIRKKTFEKLYQEGLI